MIKKRMKSCWSRRAAVVAWNHNQQLCSAALLVVALLLLVDGAFINYTSLANFNHIHSPEAISPFGKANEKLQWHCCGNGFECANLSVPLDYLNAGDSRERYSGHALFGKP